MSLSVHDLLQLPGLGLAVVAGERGLSRRVAWAHISDLPNPWDWLGPGELLLTNGTKLGSAPSHQVTYIERLEEIGASGLVVGDGTSQCRITRKLRERADELGFPLLRGPYSLRFSDVARAVAQSGTSESAAQLGAVARMYDRIRCALPKSRGVLLDIAEELGVGLDLVDLASGCSLLSPGARGRYGELAATAYRQRGCTLPGVLHLVHGVDDPRVLALPVPGARPAALVLESARERLPAPAILGHLVSAAGLELSQWLAAAGSRQRMGAELFSRLADGRCEPEIGTRELRQIGIAPEEAVVAAVRNVAATAEIGEHLAAEGVQHLEMAQGGRILFVVASNAVERLAELCSGAAIGTSAPLGSVCRLQAAVAEAVWALGVAEVESRTTFAFGEPASLLLPRTPAEAVAVASQILGPLLAHDAAFGTSYVETLRALIESDRSWRRAAAVLNVHHQTLAYRLKRIEALTGRSTTRSADVSAWWFGLRALDLAGSATNFQGFLGAAEVIGSQEGAVSRKT